jgi:hypothetical protein
MSNRFIIIQSCKECPYSPNHGGLLICRDLRDKGLDHIVPADIYNSGLVWDKCELDQCWRWLP